MSCILSLRYQRVATRVATATRSAIAPRILSVCVSVCYFTTPFEPQILENVGQGLEPSRMAGTGSTLNPGGAAEQRGTAAEANAIGELHS